MTEAPWSLASRLTRLFAITTSVLVLLITGVSALYVRNAAEKPISGLLHEELHQMMSAYDRGAYLDLLAKEAENLQRHHDKYPLGWRIWHGEGADLWAQFGDPKLFEGAEDLVLTREKRGIVQELPNDRRGLVFSGRNDLLFACVIDGSDSLGALRGYGAIGVFLVVVTVASIFLIGHFLLGRVSRTLHQVAMSVRTVKDANESVQVDLSHAPREIREIVSALQELLAKVRVETERNRVFTASLAHELRSPIQNLLGESEVALMVPRDANEYRRVLASHLQELRDLADAVDNLVTICSQRRTGDDITETRESFDLAPEAKLRLARETGYAAANGVQLQLGSNGDTRVYGDRESLLRAMRNLTANAIEWSMPGSQVDVHVLGENGRVIVTVDDAGPGVPEELKARIFEPFFRGPQARGRRIGYGLGLAIVRAAVDGQGGEVEVTRSPKGGARFCMILPRNLSLPPTDETPHP
ncbi:MAG TPA: ATP-binding protein [Planctomycetota bacterium]|nr:ATP-binding protein [Planctomycetota bacterium]